MLPRDCECMNWATETRHPELEVHHINCQHRSWVDNLMEENADLKGLIVHCWMHGGHPDCGYSQMTNHQKLLYYKIIDTVRQKTQVITKYRCQVCKDRQFVSAGAGVRGLKPCPSCQMGKA